MTSFDAATMQLLAEVDPVVRQKFNGASVASVTMQTVTENPGSADIKIWVRTTSNALVEIPAVVDAYAPGVGRFRFENMGEQTPMRRIETVATLRGPWTPVLSGNPLFGSFSPSPAAGAVMVSLGTSSEPLRLPALGPGSALTTDQATKLYYDWVETNVGITNQEIKRTKSSFSHGQLKVLSILPLDQSNTLFLIEADGTVMSNPSFFLVAQFGGGPHIVAQNIVGAPILTWNEEDSTGFAAGLGGVSSIGQLQAAARATTWALQGRVDRLTVDHPAVNDGFGGVEAKVGWQAFLNTKPIKGSATVSLVNTAPDFWQVKVTSAGIPN